MNILHTRIDRFQVEGLHGRRLDEVRYRASLMAETLRRGLSNGASVLAWTEPGVLQENQIAAPAEVVAQPQAAASVEPAELAWTGNDDALYETAVQEARQNANPTNFDSAPTSTPSAEPAALSQTKILETIGTIHDEASGDGLGLGYEKLDGIPGADQF